MIPSTINELFDSPGCTLPVRMTAGRFAISSGSLWKLVIMTISQSLPAIVLQRLAFRIRSLEVIVQILLRCFWQSE